MLDPAPVPRTVDVVLAPFAFTQTGLLTPHGFAREAKKRGVRLDRKRLELLHRRRLLVPFLQVHTRPVAPPIKTADVPMPWGTLAIIRSALADGRLTDPATRRYRPWPADADRNSIWYSSFQLLALRAVDWTLRGAGQRAVGDTVRWELARPDQHHLHDAARSRALAVALEVLAARYLPRIVNQVSNPNAALYAHIDDHDPMPELALLGLDPDRLVAQAENLLLDARTFDPLGTWYRVVRVGDPRKWHDLRFDALVAMEHRIAAEILLRCHDDIAGVGHVSALPELDPHWYHPRHERLRVTSRERAEALHDYRLTGQPAVYLALEGETEMVIASKVLDLYGLDADSDLVRLVDLEGVDHDLGLLARAVALPRLDLGSDRFARARSPIVGLVVAVDPESRYKTVEQRAKQEANMINAVLRSLPKAARTETMRANLQHLIRLRTWGTNSFEFAHFTDLQLARALRRLGGRAAPPVADLRREMATYRDRHANLDKLWANWPVRITKPELAEALWPTLHRRATSRSRGPLPPIVDVVDQAVHLAHELRLAHGMVTAPDPSDPPEPATNRGSDGG